MNYWEIKSLARGTRVYLRHAETSVGVVGFLESVTDSIMPGVAQVRLFENNKSYLTSTWEVHPYYLTEKDAADILNEVIQGKNDFVYETPGYYEEDETGAKVWRDTDCTYSDPDGNPSCIVGHVMYKVLPEALWQALVQDEWSGSGGGPVCISASHHDLICAVFEEDAVKVLGDAQVFQDGGATWGNSVREAMVRIVHPDRR